VPTGLGGLGAAFLAACGGSDSGGEKSAVDKSGLVSKPVDSLPQAKPGGSLKDFANADITSFDAIASNNASTVNQVTIFAYSRLLKFVTAKYPKEADGSVEGDLAESYELSGDKTQLTFKLRQGVKWDSRAPTNGRAMDAEDVLFSWGKYARLNTSASNLVYNAENAPSAPIDSVSAPDSRTIVMKLKQFDSSLFQLFASYDHFFVMPRESDSGFDPRSVVRGNGPWQVEEYVPSSRIIWRRNPDYYVKDRPFPDKVERPIIVDYAQLLAQFRAGNVWTTVVKQEDVVTTKKDVPKTLLRQAEVFGTGISPVITFGYEGDSPFKDTRMRQALSMLIDRDAFIDVDRQPRRLPQGRAGAAGCLNAAVAPGWTGYWIDPNEEKDFGPNHKYLKLNVGEAKKLMAAAGFPNGLTTDVYYNADNTYGAEYHQTQQVYEGMLQAGGIKLTHKSFPYQQYRDTYYDAYLSKGYIADQGLQRHQPSRPAWLPYGCGRPIRHDAQGRWLLPGQHAGRQEPAPGRPEGHGPHRQDKVRARPEEATVPGARRHPLSGGPDLQRAASSFCQSVQRLVAGYRQLGMTASYAGANQIAECGDWWVDATKASLG
jgi:ABC-type transport system substrate-binding protein